MPVPLAAAIPAAATVGSAALNVAGGLFSNKTNKKIARETNALNYQMFQEANEYNTKMWNAANTYNLPIFQKQRLLQAGVNPAALVDSPQLGQASSAPTSSNYAPAQGYDYKNVLGNIGTDMVALTQALKNAEEAKGQQIDNSNKDAIFLATLDQMVANKELSLSQAEALKQDVDFKEANWDSLSKKIHAEAYKTSEEARLAGIQADLQKYFGGWKSIAEIAALSKQVDLLVEQGKTEQATQLLNKKLGNKADADAISTRIVANSTAASNYASAEQSRTQAGLNISLKNRQDLENAVYKEFGNPQAAAQFLKDYYDGKIKSYDEFERWYETKVLNTGLGKVSKGVGVIFQNLLPILGRIQFRF